jgi:hypothetical protein
MRGYGKRFIVRADEELTAFFDLQHQVSKRVKRQAYTLDWITNAFRRTLKRIGNNNFRLSNTVYLLTLR